jgi:hypothetical protein
LIARVFTARTFGILKVSENGIYICVRYNL